MRFILSILFALFTVSPALADRVIQADATTGIATQENFIKQGNAELVTTGIRFYNDGSVARPVDCSGGTSTLTFARAAGTALSNQYYWSLGKGTGDLQGQGVAIDFKVDGSVSKVDLMKFYGEKIVSSGLFIKGTDLDDSSLIYAFYDRDKAEFVNMTGYGGFYSESETNKEVFINALTSNLGSTNYTLCIHVARAELEDYTVLFDEITLAKLAKDQPTVSIEGNKSVIRFNNGGNRASTNTGVVYYTNVSEAEGNGLRYVNTSALGTEVHILRNGYVTVTSTRNQAVSGGNAQITKNATSFSLSNTADQVLAGYAPSSGAGVQLQMSGTSKVKVGDIIRVVAEQNTSAVNISNTFSVLLIEDNSTNIIQDIETFNSSRNPLVWSGTAITDASPIGTVNTFTYAANGNARVLATTRPTQTDADMLVNGLQIFTRAYNAASTAGSPSRFEIKIGKGYKGTDLKLFKDATKALSGALDFYSVSTANVGIFSKEYNPVTGILVIDAGISVNTAATSSVLYFADASTQTNGYITISASKNPALAGLNAPARQIVKVGYKNGVDWTIYSDGWVKQSGFSGSGTDGDKTIPFEIAHRSTDNRLKVFSGVLSTSTSSPALDKVGVKTVSNTQFTMWAGSVLKKYWKSEGYASSAALAALGVYVNY